MIPKEYRGVVVFLVKFIGLYLVLNIGYGFFVEFYQPDSDPFTQIITSHVVFFLSLMDTTVSSLQAPGVYYIRVLHGSDTVISVFEGCNSINVMIVYVSFLFAFKGPWKLTLQYMIVALLIIYIMNLLRVILLYEVSLYYPRNLYFFHKYFFTGILYLVVFALWYFWIKRITKLESGAKSS